MMIRFTCCIHLCVFKNHFIELNVVHVYLIHHEWDCLSLPTVNEQIIPVECVAIGKEVHKNIMVCFSHHKQRDTRSTIWYICRCYKVHYQSMVQKFWLPFSSAPLYFIILWDWFFLNKHTPTYSNKCFCVFFREKVSCPRF